MQPWPQALVVTGPLSWLEQPTITLESYGTDAMMFRGQAVAQAIQPVHSSWSTTAMPFSIFSAPNWQAATQLPKPRQP